MHGRNDQGCLYICMGGMIKDAHTYAWRNDQGCLYICMGGMIKDVYTYAWEE